MRGRLRFSSIFVHRAVRCLGLFLVLIAALVLCHDSLGQSSDTPSLGDVARKERQRQKKDNDDSAKPKRVITDEDIPAREAKEDAPPADGPHDASSVQRSASDVLQNGDQMRTAIAGQKALIDELKSRIDKLNDSIQFVEANAYTNGVQYNKVQARKQQEVERMRGQLSELQRDLEQMQEKARKAGYGSAVWDPEPLP